VSEPVDPPAEPTIPAPSFGGWLGSTWLYTVLRIGLFLVLWGLLALVGLSGFIAAVVAAALSIPLAFVLLARPRARFAAQVEARVAAQRARRASLDAELDPDAGQESDGHDG
jgi:Protein of unknown function (DUF4229)